MVISTYVLSLRVFFYFFVFVFCFLTVVQFSATEHVLHGKAL